MMCPLATRTLHALAVMSLLVGAARAQEEDVLGRAMRDELARSMKELRLADLERPYFIAYQVSEVETVSTAATAGSLLSTNALQRRMLSVEVRVGDYQFDNSNFLGGMPTFGIRGSVGLSMPGHELPLDDDYLEIRRNLWLATDAAYKEAAERLAQKRAALLNRARTDTLPDFSKEPATRTVDERSAPPVRRADAEGLVRELSRVGGLSEISAVSVDLDVATTRTRYVNSEGTTYVTSRPLVMLSARVSTQAKDGPPVAGSFTLFARSVDSLPARDRLTREVKLLALRLDSLRAAPMLERYNGPILFEGRAAAELFAETFAPAVLARRTPASDPEMAMFMRMAGRLGIPAFGDKLGGRVMADFLSVVDDPTVASHGGVPLLGDYKVDDEGVPGRRTRIIEGGVLRSLLSTRTPVEGVPRSTGNRRGGMAAPSNLIVEARGGASERELRDRLMALVRRRGLPYGVIVRDLGERGLASMEDGPVVMVSMYREDRAAERAVLRAYRRYPDGREELVRPGRLTGMDAAAFKDIVAVSRTATVHHSAVRPSFDLSMLLGLGLATFNQPVSSYVVPSLLFEDVALTSPARQRPTLPLVPPPARRPR
jgi:hypothetical protein